MGEVISEPELDIEFNEQRVKDIEIPLYNLEQKMERLEAQVQSNKI